MEMAVAVRLDGFVGGCVSGVSVVALAHYFCLVQAAAAIGFIRGLTGRQSVLWRRFIRVTASQAVQVPR